jgi:hypothetical protein
MWICGHLLRTDSRALYLLLCINTANLSTHHFNLPHATQAATLACPLLVFCSSKIASLLTCHYPPPPPPAPPLSPSPPPPPRVYHSSPFVLVLQKNDLTNSIADSFFATEHLVFRHHAWRFHRRCSSAAKPLQCMLAFSHAGLRMPRDAGAKAIAIH